MNLAALSEYSLVKLEARLASAARQHVAQLRSAEEAGADEMEARALLKRLGLSWEEIGRIGGTALEPGLGDRVHAILTTEMARLARQVRCSSPGYDINRHIAVRRVLNRFFPAPGTLAKSPLRRPRRGRGARPAPRGRPQ